MKNRTLIFIIAISLAALMIFVAAPLINSASAEKVTVVQLKEAVPEGKMITEDDITTVEIGKLGVSNAVITKPELVIGKYAASVLYPNTNLTPDMFTASDNTATNVIANLDKDHVAISVAVDSFASSVSAKIKNGDVVSVIVNDQTGTYIPEALTYMKVITTTTGSGLDTDQTTATEDGVATPATITFYATPLQAKLLAGYDSRANMHFTLVARADSPNAAEFLAEQDEILKKVAKKAEAELKNNNTQAANTNSTNSTNNSGGENNG